MAGISSWARWRIERLFGHVDGAQLLERYRVTSPSERQASAQRAKTDFEKLFFGHQGRTIDKWLHYLPVYDRYLSGFRGKPFTMLEIGVFKGGSLELWRKYFGEQAKIFGVDIDPQCAQRVDPPNQVRIGSQDDPVFLRSVVAEMGPPDFILDDGSHIGRHQRTSFEVLFPLLKTGGLYMIEDLQTAYWHQTWEGGYRKPGTAIEHVKSMIDDLHAWYHEKPTTTPARDQIGAIHVHDSIVVLEKVEKSSPQHMRVGVGNA